METHQHTSQIAAHEITRVSSLRSLIPLSKELKPHLRLVVFNQIICLLVLGIGAAIPFGLKHLAEEILQGNMNILLWVPPIVFVLMSLLAVGHMLRGLLAQYISIKVSQSLQQRIFAHFLDDDIEKHSQRPVGEKMSRMTFDIEWFVQGSAIFLSETLFLPLVIIGCSAIMFHLDWRMALIAIALCPLGLLAGRPFSRYLRKSSMELQDHYAVLSRHILDSLKGLLLIKVFAREKKENAQLNELLSKFVTLNLKNNLWAGLFSTALAIGNALVICLVFWAAFFFFAKGSDLEIPTIIAFVAIMMFFFSEVSKLGGVMNVLTRASVSVDRIFTLLNEKQEKNQEGDKIASFGKSLIFDDVSFLYGDKSVFSDVNLTIRRGEKVALMGMSGAGKTTLINLMLNLLSPTKGRITFDGVDIAEMDTTTLRNLFGYSPQLSVLFYMTIGENIAYSKPGATEDETINAAKVACAHDFIMALPDGYNTMMGEDGANLSEGQRQRLALARSVLRDAPILVLDESSAHVDLITERTIYKNIMALKDKTVILVSHRPSVLREADRLLSIAEGSLVDVGTFADYEKNLPHRELLKAMEFVH